MLSHCSSSRVWQKYSRIIISTGTTRLPASNDFNCPQCAPYLLPNSHSFSSFVPKNAYLFKLNVNLIASRSHISTDLVNSVPVSRLGQSELVLKAQELIINFHDYTGLSWWGTIIACTVLLRSVVVFPLAIHQQYVLAKVEQINHELDTTVKDAVTKEIQKEAKLNNWNSKTMKWRYKMAMQKRKTSLYLANNCHPLKNIIIILIQMPTWVCVSTAFRNMVSMIPADDADTERAYFQLKATEILWISDLTLPDNTYVIPILICLFNLLLFEINRSVRVQQLGGATNVLLVLMRVVVFSSLYFTRGIPSGITLYWLTSCIYGFGQNLFFLSPSVRKFLRIPNVPSLKEKPFHRLRKRIEGTLKFFKY